MNTLWGALGGFGDFTCYTLATMSFVSRNRFDLLGFIAGVVIMVVLLFPPISLVLPPVGLIIGAAFDRRRNKS